MAAALLTATGCATLGGTTRHFDETSAGAPTLRASQRVPAQDHLEVSVDPSRDPAAIRARVSLVLTCRVLRSTPRIVTRSTTQTANRALFGAEVALAIVGTVITVAAASSAVKACPSGNPDTCDISKAAAWLSGIVTGPFLVSTGADLALTGGTQRSTRETVASSLEEESVEECGRQSAARARAELLLPDGEVLKQTSADDGSLLFNLTVPQLTRLGSKFDAHLFVEGAPRSISFRMGE